MFLPDVNVWVAVAFDRHIHHHVAKTWFDARTDGECAFCRITQMAFLRLATNPKVLQAEALTLAGAWRVYDLLLGDTRVSFSDEPAAVDPLWRSQTQASVRSPKVWTDAYLAAFAAAAGFNLATFDRGFSQYTGVLCTILA
jgi:toxin-antitoxin system PIN domain toxin